MRTREGGRWLLLGKRKKSGHQDADRAKTWNNLGAALLDHRAVRRAEKELRPV